MFTTNYDTLLERAADEITSKRYDRVLNVGDLVYSTKPRIVKLHGTLRTNPPYIITEEDYRRYPIDYAPFVNTVRQSLIENALCLIGFSGDDPNFVEWTGWIHDNMDDQSSPRIYLIEVFPVSEAHRRLLERRNITLVDLSEYSAVQGGPDKAIEWFLNLLLSETRDSPLEWPETDHDLLEPKPGMNNDDWKAAVTGLELAWRHDRLSFPGWVVVPDDRRTVLWGYTYRWMRAIRSGSIPPDAEHLGLVFEFVWRIEKCLCPLPDVQAVLLEEVLSRDVSGLDESSSMPTMENGGAPARSVAEVRFMRHSLLLVLLRYYREEGKLQEWQRTYDRLYTVLGDLAPEHRADLHYQSALYAVFALDIPAVREKLAAWRVDDNLPFWSVKKAGILAEIGELSQAISIVNRSLKRIRERLNLKPITSDYTIVSQEAYTMVLLRYLRNSEQFSRSVRGDQEVLDKEASRELTERWNILKQYRCDPWSELNGFEVSLERIHSRDSRSNIKRTFDIGVVTMHYSYSIIDKTTRDALRGYNFLRFCEDIGIPFRIPASTFGKTAVEGALSRIADDSPYWAMASMVRLGDAKDVDLLINRLSLARMSVKSIDALIVQYLRSIRQSESEIQSGDPLYRSTFGIVIGTSVPELLSRFVVKSSPNYGTTSFRFTLDLYHSDNRLNYSGVRNLVRRLVRAYPDQQVVPLIHELTKFPVVQSSNPLVAGEFINPFEVILEKQLTEIRDSMESRDVSIVGGDETDRLISDALSEDESRRRWAIPILTALYQVGLLSDIDGTRFADALWARTDKFGLPQDTGFDSRAVYLSLPAPTDRTVSDAFRAYVEGTPFPIQGDRGSVAMTGDVPLCFDIINAGRHFEWSNDDVCELIDRAAAWWDSDKAWLQGRSEPGPFGSVRGVLTERLQHLVDALAVVLAPEVMLNGEDSRRDTLRRLAAEFRDYGLQVVRLEACCLHIFPEWREAVFRNIGSNVGSETEKRVVDGLNALLVVSERGGRSSESDSAWSTVCQAIRWRRDAIVRHYLDVVGDMVERFPEMLSSMDEGLLLVGLRGTSWFYGTRR